MFERDMGMLAVFGEGHDPIVDAITDGLGERWDTTAFAVKPYSAQAMTHAAVDAARTIRAELTGAHGSVDVDDVTDVEVAVGQTAFDHGSFPIERPLSATSAQMSLRYTTAVTLLDGTALLAQYRASRLDDDTTWSVIDRLDVEHEETFDGPDDVFRARVRVRTKDGTDHEADVPSPTGGPGHLLDRDAVVEKFRTVTAEAVETGRARELEDLVLHLDEHDDGPARLLALLAPAVRDALGD